MYDIDHNLRFIILECNISINVHLYVSTSYFIILSQNVKLWSDLITLIKQSLFIGMTTIFSDENSDESIQDKLKISIIILIVLMYRCSIYFYRMYYLYLYCVYETELDVKTVDLNILMFSVNGKILTSIHSNVSWWCIFGA